MPLIHSSSPKAFKTNVGNLMKEVGKSPHIQSRQQALAVAFETQRRGGRAAGGVVGYDAGGPVNPYQMPPNPSQNPGIASPGVPGAPPVAGPPAQGVAGPPAQGNAGPPGQGNSGPPGTGMSNPPAPGAPPAPGQWSSGVAQNAAPPAIAQNAPPMGAPPGPVEPMQRPLMARGGALNRAGGGFNVAKSPSISPPWFSRNEARGMMHTGPILSAVPGRTDHHMTHVPSGSYVIPADIVSGRGQGNTIAGASALQRMFKMGPYGSSPGRIRAGRGAPRLRAEGGEANSDVGQPVPVNLAGGEIVVPPENLMDVVHPNLKHAHAIMDAWVLHERSNLRKTLAKLPGPARD